MKNGFTTTLFSRMGGFLSGRIGAAFSFCTVLALFCASALVGCSSSPSPEPLSVKMVRSEMSRCPDASYLDGMEGTLKWNYTTGLELLSFIDVYNRYGDRSVYDYALSWYGRIIDSTGAILNYKLKDYKLDHICPGRTLLALKEEDMEPRYEAAISTLRGQISSQPRTVDGGFYHKASYPDQMWLDGLYMCAPFYVQTALRYLSGKELSEVLSDIASQFDLAFSGCLDSSTGLPRHAFDRSRKMFWADSVTGQSAHSWGRAAGWYVMALVEVLDYFPKDDPHYGQLLEKLRYMLDILPRYADSASGMWYQVLDRPASEGNYLEATCSAMFVYSYLKSVRLGYIDKSKEEYARGLYDSFLKTFVTEDENGLLSIHNCCSVAGLGGKQMRDGSYDYYIHEKIIDNDCKGVGPFIWASLEYELE